jgi:hypothetical protein
LFSNDLLLLGVRSVRDGDASSGLNYEQEINRTNKKKRAKVMIGTGVTFSKSDVTIVCSVNVVDSI